jgi:hypothetical protein
MFGAVITATRRPGGLHETMYFYFNIVGVNVIYLTLLKKCTNMCIKRCICVLTSC